MIAFARFSRTYAFIPWMIAMTATRNATETMIPSSVKKERSLLARSSPTALVTTSLVRIRAETARAWNLSQGPARYELRYS